MGSPATRARYVRGALVAASSAAVTTGAHALAGGPLPHGTALVVALLACSTVGAVVAGPRLPGRLARWFAVAGALLAAQGLGHLALTIAAGHHELGIPSAAMIASHVIGALVLGPAINTVEYLYAVCVSVLCWLRLFATAALRPMARQARLTTSDVVAQPILLRSGLGMRAPPSRLASPA